MAVDLGGMKVAFLVANEGVERVELTDPWRAVSESGGQPVLIALEAGEVRTMDHLDWAERRPVDVVVAEADPADYDALVLPGGVANPDQLRMDRAAVQFVSALFAAGRPAAVICHGPWTLIEAGLVQGRTLTSWPSLRTDITNAGGTWVDESVQVCPAGPNVLVTSRRPDDLPDFNRAMLEAFSSQVARRG